MIILLILLFSSTAFGAYHVVPCNHDNDQNCVVWTEGFAPDNSKCRVSGVNKREKDSIRSAEIAINEVSLFEKVKQAVGLGDDTPKRTVCTLDKSKRSARIAADKLAREAVKEARETKRQAKKDAMVSLKAACESAKGLDKKFCDVLEKLGE